MLYKKSITGYKTYCKLQAQKKAQTTCKKQNSLIVGASSSWQKTTVQSEGLGKLCAQRDTTPRPTDSLKPSYSQLLCTHMCECTTQSFRSQYFQKCYLVATRKTSSGTLHVPLRISGYTSQLYAWLDVVCPVGSCLTVKWVSWASLCLYVSLHRPWNTNMIKPNPEQESNQDDHLVEATQRCEDR